MANQKRLTPAKYIKTKARALPIHECLINENWQQTGMTSLMVTRKMPSGNYVIGIYNIDIFCLGVKNAAWNFNMLQKEYDELCDKFEESSGTMVQIPANEAHNIIYGAIDYAQELGFKPHEDFAFAEYILDPNLIDDGIDEIEFGQHGRPSYFTGPYDNVNQILATLNKNVGEDNYYFTEIE